LTLKSFFTDLKNVVVSMWKKAPAAEVTLASGVNYLVPFVEEIDDLAIPTLAPIINPILDKIKVGLSALATTIKQVGPVANVQSITASLSSNFQALESAVQIKDPATATRINQIGQLVISETQSIATNFQSLTTTATTSNASTSTAA
jgi:hypothetical protein